MASKSTKGKTGVKETSLTTSASQSNSTAREVHASEGSSSIQSYILFWLDSNINPTDADCHQTIAQLQSIVSNVHVFNDGDACIDYLSTIKNQKVFMVVSGSIGEHILPRIYNMPQLSAVFVYCSNRQKYESLTKYSPKVRGIFTDLSVLCGSVKEMTRQCDENSIDISLVSASDPSDQRLDNLDQSFMYTQLIKEILFELKHDDDSVKKLVTYCLDKFSNDTKKVHKIQEFQNGYQKNSPIWWYTYECFIYHLLNWALRNQEFDVIIRMAFFIYDLHRHIEELHSKQSQNFSKEFTVYRGLAMEPEKFEQLKGTMHGLISFNNFLSTSVKETVALGFVKRSLTDMTPVGVLFIITVNPSVSSAPFACLDEVSYYKTLEKEILFSMHTVFRINDIKQNNIDRVWRVHLTLTSDTDKQLNSLIERMRMEIEGSSPLYRLGALMIKVGEFQKAEEIYRTLQERTSDELEQANLNYQLGCINDNYCKYDKALRFYQDALGKYLKHLPPDHPNVASCYNNIGLVYDNTNDYAKALPCYEKALKIYQKTLSADHSHVATSCNSIGLVHNSLGDYSKALSFCKQALDIFEKSLPPTHPMLAMSHNNIGLVYGNLKKYSEAISSYKRAVDIGQKALPPGHPQLKVYKQNLESVPKKGNK